MGSSLPSFGYLLLEPQAARQVLFSVLPLVKRELQFTDTRLGRDEFGFSSGLAVLVPLAGTLVTWSAGSELIDSPPSSVWSFAAAASGLTAGFLSLVVCRSATAFGEAFYYPSANSMIGDYHGEKSRATAMAVHPTSAYTGIIVSGALAGYVGQKYGWRAAFISFGAVGMVVAAIASVIVREPRRGQSELAGSTGGSLPLKERLAETFQIPTAVILILAFLGMTLVNAAYLTWTPTLLVRKFGFSLARAGFHATFWHLIGAALGVLLGGRIGDAAAARSVVSRPAIQFAGLLLGAPFIFLLGWSTRERWCWCRSACSACSGACTSRICLPLCTRSSVRNREPPRQGS